MIVVSTHSYRGVQNPDWAKVFAGEMSDLEVKTTIRVSLDSTLQDELAFLEGVVFGFINSTVLQGKSELEVKRSDVTNEIIKIDLHFTDGSESFYYRRI